MYSCKFANLFGFLLVYDLQAGQVNIAHETKDTKTFCVCHLHISEFVCVLACLRSRVHLQEGQENITRATGGSKTLYSCNLLFL